MAGFMDSISKGVTAVNVKSGNMLEKNKSKTYISTLEKEIADLKQQAGGIGYTAWKNGEDGTAKQIPLYEMIAKKEEEIETQQAHILQLDQMEQQILGKPAEAAYVFCSSCGFKNAQANRFCQKCGAPMK